MYYFYGKINRGQASRPLYRGCPLFGGSVIRGFTVTISRESYMASRFKVEEVTAAVSCCARGLATRD